LLINPESKWSLWDHETDTYETRDQYLMRPRPRPRPITLRPRPRPRPRPSLICGQHSTFVVA